MNAEPIREKITRWSLKQIEFLLSQIEGFIEDDRSELLAKVKAFSPQTGLETIEKLLDADPRDARLAEMVLDRLSAFFDSGLLFQRHHEEWQVTDLFSRGQMFHLEVAEHMGAKALVPEIPPLVVQRANAAKLLKVMNLQFLNPSGDAEAYLIKPTPHVAYTLISRLAQPWSVDHLAHAQRLINKSFIF